jgi:transcription elongation GreA/GreB family factor
VPLLTELEKLKRALAVINRTEQGNKDGRCDSLLVSRAFVKEDVDPPERSGRKRSRSGLPPGATNYMTSRGAAHLGSELTRLREAGTNAERVTEIERILASAQIVEPRDAPSKSVAFGATVTVTDHAKKSETFTIVGVDELDLYSDGVSWISPTGKKLLAAELGDRITLDDGTAVKITNIEDRAG